MYQNLIKELKTVLAEAPDFFSLEALKEFEELVKNADNTSELTESGSRILAWMKENVSLHNNLFTSRTIAEGLAISSRSASGTLRKLVEDGYVEKMGSNPVSYSLSKRMLS